MAHPTKIATCCFCGSRAALKLDRDRHELSCASCGAPLRDIKSLPVTAKPRRAPVDHRQVAPAPSPALPRPQVKKKKRKPKSFWKGRGKSLFRKAAEEIFDVVEDIFD
jgi:cytochrome c peroxidase